MAAKRVVLAYSGGLDTSVAVRWMREEWGAEVVALAVDVGGQEDFEAVRERALAAGAVDARVVDAREEFASEFVARVVRANALYEGKYPVSSSLSRPLIARHLVRVAREVGADAVAHGCTGKGNDQVRFEVSSRALAPDLEVLAPVREWGMTRDDCIEYARRYEIPITVTREKPYSIDENLWGKAIECGAIEDPWAPAPEDVFTLVKPPPPGSPAPVLGPESLDNRDIRDQELGWEVVTVGFEEGVPVSVDGEPMPLHTLVGVMNDRVGRYGWGSVDMVENRRVGIKSREVYECPGALSLIMAHADLESVTLERDLAREKQRVDIRYAELVYDGLWFSPLREALDAFVESSQRHVTGEVRLALSPGSCAVAGRRAQRPLYDEELATYGEGDRFRHEDAAGFVRLWGLGLEVWSRRQGGPS